MNHKLGAFVTKLAVKTVSAVMVSIFIEGCAAPGGQPYQLPMIGVDSGGSPVLVHATSDPCSHASRDVGALVGGIAGLALATHMNKSDMSRSQVNTNKMLGVGVGALIGGLIGADMDRQRCELSKIAKKHNIQIELANVGHDGREVSTSTSPSMGNPPPVSGLTIRMPDPSLQGGHFLTGSDQLTPQARRYFADIADMLNVQKTAQTISDPQERSRYLAQAPHRRIFLVGHTDDTGTNQYNTGLSERRARAVASYLAGLGIDSSQVFYQGAGEMFPIADNNTEAGRQANRRVEIVQVESDEVFHNYLAKRTINPSLFQASKPTEIIVASPSVATTPTGKPKDTNKKTVASLRKKAAPTSGVTSATTALAPASGQTTSPAARISKAGPIDSIDFGGNPFSPADAAVDAGKIIENTGFSLFSQSHADEPRVLSSCLYDKPRMAGEIRSLRDGKSYRTSEKMPGLFGRSWYGMVGAHMVTINRLTVLQDGGVPTNQPEVNVYKNYTSAQSNAKADISESPQMNVYRGTNGVLIRTFFNDKKGLRCMDLLAPIAAPFVAKSGRVVYLHGNGNYVAAFTPHMAN